MARTVRDAAILLGGLAGVDPRGPGHVEGSARKPPRLHEVPRPGGPPRRPDRRGPQRTSASTTASTRSWSEALDGAAGGGGDARRSGGHPERSDQARRRRVTVLLYELKADLNAYLARLGPGAPVTLAEGDHRRSTSATARRRCRTSARSTFLKAEAKGPLTTHEYLEALAKCRRLSRDRGDRRRDGRSTSSTPSSHRRSARPG